MDAPSTRPPRGTQVPQQCRLHLRKPGTELSGPWCGTVQLAWPLSRANTSEYCGQRRVRKLGQRTPKRTQAPQRQLYWPCLTPVGLPCRPRPHHVCLDGSCFLPFLPFLFSHSRAGHKVKSSLLAWNLQASNFTSPQWSLLEAFLGAACHL